MPATLLGIFPSTGGLFLFLEVETWNIWWWLGLVFVWGKGGYRRCHDTSRKNKVRRKRDVVVIGGQGLDFPADLHDPWLLPYGPFFFYPEICPCLQPAGILTLEHQIMSDTGNERTGLWATVTKGFQQPLSCRKYIAGGSCTVLSGPVPLHSRHLQLTFVLPSWLYKLCLRILLQTRVNVEAITLRFSVLRTAPIIHPNPPLLFSAWQLPRVQWVRFGFTVSGVRVWSFAPINLGLPEACKFTHSLHENSLLVVSDSLIAWCKLFNIKLAPQCSNALLRKIQRLRLPAFYRHT